MTREKARSTGTVLAAAAGGLSAGYFILAGLVAYLMTNPPVPGGIGMAVGYEIVGFALLVLSAGVFMMWKWARTLSTLAFVALAILFTYVSATAFTVAEPATVVNVVMMINNAIAAVALVLSDDIVVGGRTDTSDKHATDIGTGWR